MKGNLLRTLSHVSFAAVFIALSLSTRFAAAQERTIEIHARRFEFVPAEITLKKGETVTLSLISEDVNHSLFVEGLGINVKAVKGHVTQAQVTPQQAGDFSGRCGTFCGNGHGKMTFVVHVTE